MAVLVCFHAHPDDEVTSTGGTIARAHAEGHRVVVVTATRGEHGEVQPGVLEPGEALVDRRIEELARSCEILGVDRHHFLGYVDSGMMGTPENEAPGSFWQADLAEAAGRLAEILRAEQADVLTVYDANGVYGHPDHLQVHRVGVRAAEQAGVARVYEATLNFDRMRDQVLAAAAEPDAPVELVEMAEAMRAGEGPTMGSPAALITTVVDVAPWIELKRAAFAAHASQIGPDSFFLSMPDERFVQAFGEESFIRRDAPAGTAEASLFEGL